MNGDGAGPRIGAFAGEPMPLELERAPSTTGWLPPRRLELGVPDYGVDAPVFLTRCFGFACGAALAALIVRAAGRDSAPATLASGLLLFSSACGTALGSSLLAYSRRGKLAHRNVVLGELAWRGDERILDIGTGAGLLLIGAAKRLTSGRALGIDVWRQEDLTNNTRETAMRNAYFEGVVDRVEIRYEDARKLGTSQRNSYDAVFANRVLHSIPDAAGREAACKEIARVLKPGGKAIVSGSRGIGFLKRALAAAGLEIVSDRLYLRTSFTYLRTIVAVKPRASSP
jgi:SAM-dependent methyltransferase